MTFEPAMQILEAARRSADATVHAESALWRDAQYDRFISGHYREMAAESLRFLEVLRERDRETATMLRMLESSR
jgi:hypothetical protein